MKKKMLWVGVGLFILIDVIVLFLILRPGDDPLSDEVFRGAWNRWREAGIGSYRMTVEVAGDQKGRHDVEVLGGKVTAMTTSGSPAPRHVWEFWSVDGMFTFLQDELRNAENPKRNYGVEDASSIVMRAHFDAERGLPVRFQRNILGTGREIRWTILSFEPIRR